MSTCTITLPNDETITIDESEYEVSSGNLHLAPYAAVSFLEDWCPAQTAETGNLYAWSAAGESSAEPLVIAFSDGEDISFEWWFTDVDTGWFNLADFRSDIEFEVNK